MKSPEYCYRCDKTTKRLLVKTTAQHLPFFQEGRVVTAAGQTLEADDPIMAWMCEGCKQMRSANLPVDRFTTEG